VGAQELWEPHLPGVDEGMAAGALPPPGLYGVLDNYSVAFSQYDNNGHKTGVKIDGQVEVPIVLWQTGIKVLGADYAMALAQPLDYSNLKVPNDPNLSDNGHWGTFNTILAPGILSWSLPNDFHVKTALWIVVDDASSSPGHPPAGGGLGSGNGFWTVQPELGVSWLHDGWNLSMDAFYSYNFKNTATQYTSGQELEVDYTVAKILGNWTLGLGPTRSPRPRVTPVPAPSPRAVPRMAVARRSTLASVHWLAINSEASTSWWNTTTIFIRGTTSPATGSTCAFRYPSPSDSPQWEGA
jgi:hypothetical protein